jgi:DNA-binding NarL/FixJ family response regulator
MIMEQSAPGKRAADRPRVRVFLIDRHAVIRAGLRLLLESQQGFVVIGEAAEGQEALRLAAACQPDVVVLNLSIGAESALALLPELRQSIKGQTLLLTALNDPELQRQAIRLGASGLVQKSQEPGVLLGAIERVHAGEVWFDRSMMAALMHELPDAGSLGAPSERRRIAALTQREREVIGWVGEGCKNRQIAERMVISETTVRHHLTSIFDKLGVSDRLELVIYAFRHGLARLPIGQLG